jgi:hypothetical protein
MPFGGRSVQAMTRQGPFRATVDELKATLGSVVDEREKNGRDSDEWLRTLYSTYAERMRSDNERIWGTGSILLPLAAAGFAAFVAIDKPQLWHAIVLGIASSALAWCWLFIAENHRSFQQKSEAWLVAIQEVLGLIDKRGPKVPGNWLNRLLTFKGAVQWMRWVLVGVITVGWFVLAILCATGRLIGWRRTVAYGTPFADFNRLVRMN